MSTSAESPGGVLPGGVLPDGGVRLRDGSAARLRAVPYDDPVARDLVARVQQEYVDRYGGPDGAAVEPGEFSPPAGLFLVAEVDGEPAGCGAWRRHDEGGAAGEPAGAPAVAVAEVKRVYVVPRFRRRGLAQVLVAALEQSARRSGHRSVVLNSGDRQPEALALYEALGYVPVDGYGLYAGQPGAVFLGRRIDDDEERPWAS